MTGVQDELRRIETSELKLIFSNSVSRKLWCSGLRHFYMHIGCHASLDYLGKKAFNRDGLFDVHIKI
jgi:hypothetical protein